MQDEQKNENPAIVNTISLDGQGPQLPESVLEWIDTLLEQKNKESNKPYSTVNIAKGIGEIRQGEIDEVIVETTENTRADCETEKTEKTEGPTQVD